MKWVKHFFFPALLLQISFVSTVLVQAQDQDQSGFISIDCGLPVNSTYVDPVTNINYTSDAAFIDTGIPREIPIGFRVGHDQPLWRFRSFPEGIRNCYTLKVSRGEKYLIRTRFFIANFNQRDLEFDLYLGRSYWCTVSSLVIDDSSVQVYREIIHVVSMDRLYICLENKGKGTPFISAIELRPIPNHIYQFGLLDGSLLTIARLDMGNLGSNIVRSNKDDIYDRFWEPYNDYDSWKPISTSLHIDNRDTDYYLPPSTVMMTAATPLDPTKPLELNLSLHTNNRDSPVIIYIYLYFAELDQLKPNESRGFKIFTLVEGSSPNSFYDFFIPTYLSTTMIWILETPAVQSPDFYRMSFHRYRNSTLPPLINALEVYELIKINDYSQTESRDVDAMVNIKLVYGVTKRNWQGDPCVPESFKWDGINCSSDASNTSTIISLDLSYNNLTGPVPDFLADMPFLKVIDLSGNNLTGSVPAKLLQKSKRRSLSLRLDGNPYLCHTDVCYNANKEGQERSKKNNVFAIIVGIGVGSLLIIIFAAVAIFWRLRFKRRLRTVLFDTKSRRFTYSDFATITENFKIIIGEGGFGKVYLGQIGDAKVAVKMLSQSSLQGFKEFRAEVELLMTVHHINLVSLIGYCDEDSNLGLVYEYMALGNLRTKLSETENTLTWEQRLQITMDAAQGLDYLHRGCTPLMIHRDVKSSNILITEQFNGKVADFGLSRASPLAGGDHESTAIAGTPGYLDPEYYATGKLNEKSDVYSFGIVLLEIVTCRSAIGSSPEDHLLHYVNTMVSTGDISRIIDPRLERKINVDSVWRVLELAKACTAQESTGRPIMNKVAMELQKCLETIRNLVDESNSSIGVTSSKLSMNFGPEAR